MMTTRRAANLAILSAAALAMAPAIASAQTQETIVLPPPRADFGKSLAEALRLRRSIRSFDPRPMPPQVLSELLWAAYGVNRPATADRHRALVAARAGDRRLRRHRGRGLAL
ncbi:MAG TPA: nitroreductase family protein [Acetobacteraceae bacterium]